MYAFSDVSNALLSWLIIVKFAYCKIFGGYICRHLQDFRFLQRAVGVIFFLCKIKEWQRKKVTPTALCKNRKS